MKKLFTMMVGLAVATSAFAEDAPSFDYTSVKPAPGEVTEVKKIDVKFGGGYWNTVSVVDGKNATITLNGEPLNCTLKKSIIGGAGFTVTNMEGDGTAPGKYVVTVPAGSIRFQRYKDPELDETNPQPYVFEYTIKGASQGGDDEPNQPTVTTGMWGYTLTPGVGKVKELSEIKMVFNNSDFAEIGQEGDVPTLKCNGINVPGKVKMAGKTFTFTLNDPATAPGTYKFELPDGCFTGYGGDDGEGGYTIFEDSPAISFEYTIEAAAGQLDFSNTISPAADAPLASIEKFEVTFPALDSFTLAEGCPVVKVNGSPLSAKTDFSTAINGNVLTITPAVALEGLAEVSVELPAGGINGKKGDVTASNPEAIVYNYNLIGAVVYDLTLELNKPTNLNAEGQLDLEKTQADALFFVCKKPGMKIGSSEGNNVTLKAVNGDYEASARLRNGFGLDSNNNSYFSADINVNNVLNGEYTLTIDKGAFGDETWVANPEMGESNDEIVINFTIVGGKVPEVNTVEGTVTPAAGTYEGFDKIANVTLAFAEEMTPEEGAAATLLEPANFAGYNSTVQFVKSETAANTFTATFAAPEEEAASTVYELSIPAGQFKNAKGEGNVAISVRYTVTSTTSGVGVIGIDTQANEVYTIDGQRVTAKDLPAGIYVINGAKVLVK